MSPEPKTSFSQLAVGDEFPPGRYKLDQSMIEAYLKAAEDESALYQATGLVPPMAVAAQALRALVEGMALPPGTIHVSQELEFVRTVSINDALVSYAKVIRKQVRGKLRLLTVVLNVCNQRQEAVLAGTTTFMLPVPDENERV